MKDVLLMALSFVLALLIVSGFAYFLIEAERCERARQAAEAARRLERNKQLTAARIERLRRCGMRMRACMR